MKITNKHNLPEAIFRAATAYVRKPRNDRFSVSELSESPQLRALKMKHWDELQEDCADRLWALLGSATHYVLGNHAPDNSLSEERMVVQIPELEGIELSGQSDLYHNEIIDDYKITSVYAFLLGNKPEWTESLNAYAYLHERQGFPVKGLRINAILRDWQQSKALQQADYPQIPFITVNIPLWASQERLSYIVTRISEHLAPTVRECNEIERWYKGDTFAIMKQGRKTAVRVLGSETEASQYLTDNNLFGDKNIYIEKRKGKYNRCEGYCIVSNLCPQWAKENN